MPILRNEKKALNELKTALQESFKIVNFRIYGSKAKGTDVDGSDLDVMIILEDHSPSVESKIDDLIFEN